MNAQSSAAPCSGHCCRASSDWAVLLICTREKAKEVWRSGRVWTGLESSWERNTPVFSNAV